MSYLDRVTRRRGVASLLIVALLGVVAPVSAGADGVSQAQADVAAAQDRIEYLQDQVTILEEDQREAEDNLVAAQAAVVEAEARIATLEGQLSELRGELGDLALKTFIDGDQAGANGSLLTGASTVTEVVEREEYARLAMSAGQTSSDELDAVISDLDQAREDLVVKQAMAEQLVESVKAKQVARDKAEKDAESYLEDANSRLGQALVAEQQRRQRELIARQAADQAAAAARLAAQSNNNSGSSSNSGNSGGSSSNGGSDGGGTNADAGSSSASSPSSGNSGAGSNVPAPSPGASGAVNAAISQVGVGYQYATASPGDAFDCSGLTYWAWAQAGVSLPRNSRAQYAATTHVSPSEVQPGDLIFFYNPISHVGLYIGGGMMVDAANHSLGVRQTAVNWSKAVGVGRPG
jgi:cell wall-associated NlpC family hydrolase